MQACGREGVHVGLGDEFDGDGDVEFPGAEGLVVRGGDEAAVLVNEGDGVDGLEVVVVFLRHLPGASVVLDYFFVRHTSQAFVGGGGVHFDDVGDAGGANARGTGAGFGVPSAWLLVDESH